MYPFIEAIDDRRKKSEIRNQKSEDRSQKSECLFYLLSLDSFFPF